MTATAPTIATAELAHAELLAGSDLDVEQLSDAAGSIAKRCDFADIFIEAAAKESWSLESGKVKTGSFLTGRGMSLRAISGQATAFAYADTIDASALKRMCAAVRDATGTGTNGKLALGGAAHEAAARYPAASPLAAADADKAAVLAKLDQLGRAADPRVSEIQANLVMSHSTVLIMRADGEVFADIRPLLGIQVAAILAQGDKIETGMAGFGGRDSLAMCTDSMLSEIAQRAVAEASVKLDATEAPAGTMPVVLGNGWAGILLHEAVGHGLEGDFNRKEQSAFSGRIGEQVAHPSVTVCDDGTLTGRRGSITCDDEGCPSACNVLIENGVLKGYMQDAMNASLTGSSQTGNGRRESYAHPPMPRMTNTYMTRGEHTPEEVIASVTRGLYCKSFSGGQVDITNGNFVFSASEAYLIENGKLGRAVKGTTIIGNGPDAMRKLSMVANDFALDPGVGTCGKNGQWVPVCVGQPTCKVDELVVGGTSI